MYHFKSTSAKHAGTFTGNAIGHFLTLYSEEDSNSKGTWFTPMGADTTYVAKEQDMFSEAMYEAACKRFNNPPKFKSPEKISDQDKGGKSRRKR